MEEEENGSDEDGDVVDLNCYTARRRSPLKRMKQSSSNVEEDGKLLTSRVSRLEGNENVQASIVKSRSIRNPDFIR